MFFDSIGEYRYACSWVGNTLSRAKLEVWEDGKLTTNKEALAAWDKFYGGAEGQREMLRQVGTNMSVAGDCYIFGESQGEDDDKWMVAAAHNVKQSGSPEDPVYKIGNTELDDPLAIRMWRPHPANPKDADAPSRSVLSILQEIADLTAGVEAQIKSRLALAGVFVLPNEISFGSVRSNVPTDEAEVMAQATMKDIDALLMEIMESMMEGIEDPSSPASRTPILLQIPGDYVDKVKFITFWAPIDEQTKALREEAIRRLALGMDLPPEVLTGSGDLNHWNAWQIEEAAIKSHTEPLLQIICSSLAEAYLRPILEDGGMEHDEAKKFTIHADTSEIRLRPNRSKEALELRKEGILKAETVVTENGFKLEDMMTEEERANWLTQRIATGSTTPEQVAWALNILGVPMPATNPQVIPTREIQNQPSIAEHPTRDLPEEDRDGDVAAAEVVVFRALERAGARMRSKYKDQVVTGSENVHNADLYRYTRTTPIMIDEVLADAWDDLHRFSTKVPATMLDDYVRQLFRTGQPFEPGDLATYVRSHRG
jgi:hypothetical protein